MAFNTCIIILLQRRPLDLYSDSTHTWFVFHFNWGGGWSMEGFIGGDLVHSGGPLYTVHEQLYHSIDSDEKTWLRTLIYIYSMDWRPLFTALNSWFTNLMSFIFISVWVNLWLYSNQSINKHWQTINLHVV